MPELKHFRPGDFPPVLPPEAMVEMYKGMSLEQLGNAMYELEKELESIALQAAPLSAQYEFLRMRAIPDAAENGTAQSITIQFTPEYRGRISLTSDMYVQIIGDKAAAYEWLADNGHGGLIQKTVNAGSLKSAMKERIKKGEGTPPQDKFKCTPFKRASITRA